MIVFGSSIGAAYDPHTNTWQRLPPSTLAPEASSVGWIGRRLVAWDYEGDTQVYSPSADRWSATSQNPFGFGECYPQSIATETSMFAWFCGKAAAVGPRAGSWALASGGVTAPTVHYGGIRLKQFQTASLAPAGAVIALAVTGVVVNRGGPCFGCRGSPVRYWVYRPQPAPSADRSLPMRRSASLHLAAGQQAASVRIGYPRYGDTFTITAVRPRRAAITGYLEVDGRHMAEFDMPIDLPGDVPGRAVRRARTRSGVTDLVPAHHEAHPGAGERLRHRPLPAALADRRSPRNADAARAAL